MLKVAVDAIRILIKRDRSSNAAHG
jgi:hypothetical protein